MGMRIGIIGGAGWIGSSLGRALIETGRCVAQDLVLLNRAGEPGEFFGYAVDWARNVADLVSRVEVIVVSVRPQDWQGLQLDAKGKLVISVMAGVPLRSLPPRTLRALPNAAAELRRSYTPWIAGSGVTAADRALAVDLLQAIGSCEALESEDQLDLMTATVGAGPAYLALMARAMIGFLHANGLPEAVAERATEAMICDSAPLLAGKLSQVEQTLQLFLDYKGTTAAGLTTAMAEGAETALQSGFAAATARAKAMAAMG